MFGVSLDCLQANHQNLQFIKQVKEWIGHFSKNVEVDQVSGAYNGEVCEASNGEVER